MYFSCDEVYRRMGIAWEIKYPYYGKFMSTNFPGSPYTMCFVAFCRTMENWCENPCIFHMVTLVHFFLWLRVNMYYFHTCIYINPILLWQSLSSRCVVDHLWNLHYALCFAFWAHFFHVQCATVQVYGLPQSHCDDNRRAYCFHITYIYIYISYILYIRIYANFLRNAIVGLSNPWIRDSQDQETVLAPFADKQAHYYDTDCLYNISIWIIPEEATFKLCQVIKLITGTDHSYYR